MHTSGRTIACAMYMHTILADVNSFMYVIYFPSPVRGCRADWYWELGNLFRIYSGRRGRAGGVIS